MIAFADTGSATAWDGKRVVVLGLARSGEAAARALLDRNATVTVLDAADGDAQRDRLSRIDGARAALGRADGADIGGHDLVVASPGVPPSSPWFAAAQAAGIPVWSEVELAYKLGVRIAVAVTGTNGKTTTTEMCAAALTAAGMPAVAAGNVGRPLVDALGAERVVAEVSSFQLYAIESFHAPVSVLLNIARDHLDWHGTHAAYVEAKRRIFENQTSDDVAIHHVDCATAASASRARRVPFSDDALPEGGAGIADGWIVVPQGRVVEVERMRAKGRPNRADAVAAAAAVCALGADPAVVGEALAAFHPGPHRIETVAEIDGVTYINDSKASDPHATLAALEGRREVVLIAGGRNKALDLSELAEGAYALRAVVAIGEAAAEIQRAFAPTNIEVVRAPSLEDAVRDAAALATAGGTVLLSPACASWDMFRDYQERGEVFRAAVNRLRKAR